MKAADRISEAELHAYVDGQLAEARARDVASWLVEHPVESARVATWRAQNEAVRRAFPSPARERIIAPVRQEPIKAANAPTRSLVDYRHRLRRRRALAVSIAFAAGAMLAGSLALAFRRMADAPQPAAPIHVEMVQSGSDGPTLALAAWRAYAQDRQHPVEVSARDPVALGAWIAERTNLSALPEAAGLRLVGARVLPGTSANAAFLLYETGEGERLALVAEASLSAAPGPARAEGEIRAVGWSAHGFEFGLAGALPLARLKALAGSFAAERSH
ncbi:MAG: hypothetical protein KGM42_21040 [Hyphomicrobiales bacterium]|nr:hypothetical protein [Hyphomicrobiales bacterium]